MDSPHSVRSATSLPLYSLSTLHSIIIGTLSMTVLLGVWWIITALHVVSHIFLPPPSAVWTAWFHLLTSGTLLLDIGYTLGRVGIGLLCAIFIALPLGFVMGMHPRIYAALHGLTEFFRTIPATALFPLCIIFLGIGEVSKIALIGYASGLTLLVNVMHGVHSGSPLRRTAMHLFGVRGWLLFRTVIIPEAMPSIITGFRIALSLSMVVGIVTEMFIGTHAGIGYRIMTAQQIYDTAQLYAMLITTGFIGMTLQGLLRLLRFPHQHGAS
jgi:ABC-type nitrate/sulfonate/bicarbonate transport system permease component